VAGVRRSIEVTVPAGRRGAAAGTWQRGGVLRRFLVRVLRVLSYVRAQLWGMVLAFPVGVAVARILGHDVSSASFLSIVVPVMIIGAAVATLWAKRDLDR
jgi:hypothetical protein